MVLLALAPKQKPLTTKEVQIIYLHFEVRAENGAPLHHHPYTHTPHREEKRKRKKKNFVTFSALRTRSRWVRLSESHTTWFDFDATSLFLLGAFICVRRPNFQLYRSYIIYTIVTFFEETKRFLLVSENYWKLFFLYFIHDFYLNCEILWRKLDYFYYFYMDDAYVVGEIYFLYFRQSIFSFILNY